MPIVVFDNKLPILDITLECIHKELAVQRDLTRRIVKQRDPLPVL